MKNYKNIIVIGIFAVAIVGYYYYLSNRPIADPTDQVSTPTKIEEVLETDVTTVMNTPRETVRYYSVLLKCIYNENPSQEQITSLGDKARELLDEELLGNNPEDAYLDSLKNEIEGYKETKRIVMGYAIDSSQNVKYYTEENIDYAIVDASYTLRETEVFTKTNEEYILRKDKNGYWKILGWRISQNAVTETENEDE
jgi:hypothetical protein